MTNAHEQHEQYEPPQDLPEEGQLAAGNASALLANGGKLFLEMMRGLTGSRAIDTALKDAEIPEKDSDDKETD
jgi:hypothetical protein